MALFIEGIGGTGKAVINLLAFSTLVARHIGEPAPDLSYVVIDQDDQGVWPGVKTWQAAPHVGGKFQQAIGLVHPNELSAARLLFSPDELETEISKGFHGHPKLLAALRHSWARPQESQLQNHVIVYSDIGGTGAGLGPVRLKELVGTAGKKNVVGLVFGKYLNHGAVNPTGFRWLQDEVRLPQHAEDRSFTAFYITVPMFQVPAGVPPPSGLNPTPALLLAVELLWQLGLAGDDGMARILKLNNRAAQRERVEEAGFNTPHFKMEGSGSLPARLRQAAHGDDLAPLLPRRKEYLHHSLTEEIGAEPLRQECWRVYAAATPRGSGTAPGEDLPAAFAETFASVSDPWAAARWFHIAAARDVGPCREALLRLVALYLQGDLNVVPTNWGLDGDDRIYALCTEPLLTTDPEFLKRFQDSVVGGFSEIYPFWTVPELAKRLAALEIKAPLDGVSLVVERKSPAASAYFGAHVTTHDIDDVAPVKGKLSLVAGESLRPTRWKWLLETTTAGWDGLADKVQSWPLIGKNVSVRYGRGAFDAGGGSHSCDIAGVRKVTEVLSADGIYADGMVGLEFYELILQDRAPGGTPRRQVKRRVVTAPDAQGNPGALPADQVTAVDILVGNVVTRLSLP